MGLLRIVFPSVLALQMCPGIFGQEVISARSGMVHFTEGRVFLDDQQLDRKSGSFPAIKESSTLRTERGRAEVLLTPGAFLRLDENSSIRMVSTELVDTRLVFLSGSVILDLTDSRGGNAIEVTYRDSRARFPKKGVYRLDADTGVLQVYSGEAEATYDGKQTKLDDSHLFFCWLGLETSKLGNGTEDEFYDWASDRNQVISEENQLAQETAADPGDVDLSSLLGVGGGVYSGLPGLRIPRVMTPGLMAPGFRGLGLTGLGLIGPRLGGPYSASPYSTYSMTSPMFNPLLMFVPRRGIPFGYPVPGLTRPYLPGHPQMPHTVNSPMWHPITAGPSPLSRPLPRPIAVPGPIGVFHPSSSHVGMGAVGRPGISGGVPTAGRR